MLPQGQMPSGTSQPQRYPADEIMEQTIGMLQVPFGRTGRKKNVAQEWVQPPDPEAKYQGKPIPNDNALVNVAWTADEFESDELDIPTEEGGTSISDALGACVLWNKADIALERPASEPSQPSSSPPGGPSDDDDDGNGGNDNGSDGNNNAGSQGSSPRHSPPPPNTSKPEGGTGGTIGNETLPPSSGPTGTRQCPPVPKKPLAQDEDKPAHLTIEEWAAFNIAEEFKSSTTFKRYIC